MELCNDALRVKPDNASGMLKSTALIYSAVAVWCLWGAEAPTEPDIWSVKELAKCMGKELSVNMYYSLLLLCALYPRRGRLLTGVLATAIVSTQLHRAASHSLIRESDACVLVCFSMHVFSAALLAVFILSLFLLHV